LSVLGYVEDGEHVALALEMDLRGYGESFEEAFEALKDLVNAQLGFAMYKHGNIESAIFPAEERYFEMYNQARLEAIKGAFVDIKRRRKRGVFTTGMELPDPHVIAQIQGDYALGHG
jgi:hypothetical protein